MLKEFDLDAPTLSKEDRHTFRNQTRCITALYERLFSPFQIRERAWKMLVEVVPSVTKPHVRDLLGVLTLQINGDPDDFMKADQEGKPHIALDWLRRGGQQVAKELKWPTEPFEEAAQAVLEREFLNTWTWKREIWNKNRSISCDIEVNHGLNEATIIAQFKNAAQRHLASLELCSASPSDFAFVPLLGKARWVDDRTIELTSKDGKKHWRAVITAVELD